MRRLIIGLSLGWGIAACAAAPPPSPAPPGPGVAGPEPGASPGNPGPTDPDGVVSSPPGDPNRAPSGPDMSYRVVDMGVSVPDEWRACSAAADCELVVTTCCDHCNGGKTVAVNKANAKDVNAKYPKQCDKVACTLRGCLTRPACAEGRCVMEWAGGGP